MFNASEASNKETITSFEIPDSIAGNTTGAIFIDTHNTIMLAATAKPSAAFDAIESCSLSLKLIFIA